MSSVKIERIIATCFLVFLTVSAIGGSFVSLARAQQSLGVQTLKQTLHAMFSSIDQARAISFAEASFEFQSKTSGHVIQFNSIFLKWSASQNIGPASMKVDSVNVVFSYKNNNGGFTNVITTLDPSLVKVVNVDVRESVLAGPVPYCNSPPPALAPAAPSPQDFCNPPPPPPPCTPTSSGSSNWAGYTLKTACPTSGISFVYETKSAWNIPAVSEPWNTACQWYHCDVSVWPGLTDQPGGGDYIAQLGSRSGVYCGLDTCGYYYTLWYEFWPANSVDCDSVNSGDSITADVWNEIETGGSSNNWDFFIGDGIYHGCFTVIQHNYPLPQYGQFIAERPHWCIGINCASGDYDARLPRFSSFPMTAVMNQQYAGQTVTGYTAYTNKWYTTVNMFNCDQTTCYNNLSPSAIDTGSSFTINYRNSSAT